MITIDQLLESVDLDSEPRFVTKDYNGTISIYAERPQRMSSFWTSPQSLQSFGRIKLAEFEGKDWTECIYEVPRKTTGKIERLEPLDGLQHNWLDKINELVDAVNELKEKGVVNV